MSNTSNKITFIGTPIDNNAKEGEDKEQFIPVWKQEVFDLIRPGMKKEENGFMVPLQEGFRLVISTQLDQKRDGNLQTLYLLEIKGLLIKHKDQKILWMKKT